MGVTHELPKPIGLSIFCLLLASVSMGGTVSMDGSLPGTVAVSGSTYNISAGRRSGANQFYSFSQLNLVKGDIASFSATFGVTSVFARVTGGQSSIDGVISAPSASFYLINNHGVIFGPDAGLNVGGAFVVTTADELKFADGKVFMATPSGSDATLSTAAPSAFGFLSASPQPITINGSTLSVSTGQSFNVASGPITITGGNITTSNGQVGVVAAGSSGTVNISSGTLSVPPGSFTKMADVTIQNQSFVSDTGGKVTLAGDKVAVANSQISSNAGTTESGGGPEVQISGTSLSLEGATISSNSSGSANAGNVNISTTDSVSIQTGSSISCSSSGTGAGGSVTVTANDAISLNASTISADAPISGAVTVYSPTLTLSNGSSISTNTIDPSNNSCDVTIKTSNLSLDDSKITAYTSGPASGGNINVDPLITGVPPSISIKDGSLISDSALSGSAGMGGDIDIEASTYTLNSSSLVSSSLGSGPGGSVTVTATDTISLSASAISADAPISGAVTVYSPMLTLSNGSSISTNTTDPSNNSCDVTIKTSNLSLDDSKITAYTSGEASGGDIKVDPLITGMPPSVSIKDGSLISDSALSGSTGMGGDVTVTAGRLSILNGAEIDASTNGTGAGGNCNVSVSGALTLDGGSSGIGFSHIGAASLPTTPGGGPAGNVTVTAGTLSISNGAQITAASAGTATAGNVTVGAAGQITLQSGSALTVSSVSNNGRKLNVSANGGIQLFDSSITTSSGHNGGDITLSSPGIILLRDSPVSAFAQHNGGNIMIDPTLVVLDDSPMSANAVLGSGGAIKIAASDAFLQFDSPITFHSTFGVQGSLTLLTPQLDLTGALVALSGSLADLNTQLEPTCAMYAGGNSSTLIESSSGGLPPRPGGWSLLPIPDNQKKREIGK